MSFDAIAPHYWWIERVAAGTLLQRCRTKFIVELAGVRSILLLGEGRGGFLMELLHLNPKARITCVDASERMLDLTRARFQRCGLSDRPHPSTAITTTEDGVGERNRTLNITEESVKRAGRNSDGSRAGGHATGQSSHSLASRVRFVHADILSGDWDGSPEHYDAVACHFFLDCFRSDQLAHICSTVAACTVPGAPWLISDFCVPERGWQRVRARCILAAMYEFFRRVSRLPAARLTSPDAFLEQAGFQLKRRRYFNHGLLHSDVWVKA